MSFLGQKQMCPLIRIFDSTLDVHLIQNMISKLQQGIIHIFLNKTFLDKELLKIKRKTRHKQQLEPDLGHVDAQ